MKQLTILATFCMLIISACKPDDPMQRFEKLSGLWQTHNSEADLYEEWTKSANGVLYGKGYVLNEGDSIINETIELKKIGEDVFYIPTVRRQNNNQAVQFKLKTVTDSAYVFENTDHDFPQRITYRFIGTDSIVAKIQGIVDGEPRSEEFYYSRVPHSPAKN